MSFAYPGGGAVIEDFNLAIEPGQRVGLVGLSGGGKSTMLAVLQRFYDIASGRILIDGQDISRLTQESLREAIAIVPQDISLFHRTVLENIRYAPAGGERGRGAGGGGHGARAATSSRRCRRASPRWSAIAA